ncbi:DNA starvation/stationary phase protection protein [Mesobacillus subterraneus]|jgi:starvation-inducible DNA-binding protein|uniref:Dps family protein n=1 Tax=Mesobacillus subterraneus TaxID=285983 RepID=UPI00203EA36E|nr:DNA starvation/stationary phase protection protein [Mesobacillus subterraneus]MCM3665939.1 DNA starvation/stationary phase protection protein [Mesobacillus subterraneus]MCM3684822.1 DNA starvation/stationary phase protection protein [Mesobacillus subterraneus]
MAKKDVIQAVNQQVANWTVLYTKLHNYHWYVKGRHFFTLHVKFEELYNEAGIIIDEFAERILALEGKPVATLKECLDLSTIKEAKGNEKEEDMVSQLHDDFSKIVDELQEGIEIAEQEEDAATADMLTEVKKSLRKHMWMFKAYLG